MKICPQCNRTYADETMRFCFDDGATLSHVPDREEDRSLPPTRLSTPAATEVLNVGSMPSGSRGSHISTIQALGAPDLYSSIPKAPPMQRKRGNTLVGVIIGTCVLLTIGVATIVWFALRDGSDSRRETVVTNANVRPSPSPTATKEEDLWNERNDAMSLQGENLTYYRGTTPEQCQADCAENQKCKGFTYIRAGAYNPNDAAMCYLASKVTGEASHNCCISAVKR